MSSFTEISRAMAVSAVPLVPALLYNAIQVQSSIFLQKYVHYSYSFVAVILLFQLELC